MSYSEEYKDCLAYIDKFWDKVTIRPKGSDKLINAIFKKSQKRMHKNVINMPNAFIVPNDEKFTHAYYWDTFFIFRGLIRTKREWLLKSMVDNFAYLYEKYGIIPNFNSPASTGRSQPPFFTSMILDTYNGPYFAYLGSNPFKKAFLSLEKNKDWLAKTIEIAKKEYWHVWMDPHGHFHHLVSGYQLNRYGDRDIGYAHSSELESGWDFTSRFYGRCDEYLPIDLNVYLYKYERDFAKIAKHLDEPSDQKYWWEIAQKRKREINKYLWNEKKGFFFNYGHVHNSQSTFMSLAGFTPLWAGVASPSQAEKMVEKIPLFETKYGLLICTKDSMPPKTDLSDIPSRYRHALTDLLRPKQWDYPHIWPPLEYLTVIGLLKYGYTDIASRIMKNSLALQAKIFRKHGTFYEKIDGVKGKRTGNFHYVNQAGFGWTNAAFYRYTQILDNIESGQNIYVKPKPQNPPYKLSVPH